jgi:AAA+ superfamily predicted ATPase
MGLQSPLAILGESNTLPVNVHIDNLDGISEALGDGAKDVIKDVVSGLAEGISKAGKDKNFGKNVQDGLSGVFGQTADAFNNAMHDKNIGNSLRDGLTTGATQATDAFRDAMNDTSLKNSIKDGADAWASNVGQAAQGAQKGLEREVWPAMSQMSNQGIASVFNLQNAAQIFGPIILGSVVSISATYGVTLCWKLLEQRLLNPKPAILLPGSKVGRWDRISLWRAGYQSPAMIFDEQVKDRLVEIEEKTKNIRDHIYNGRKATYDNLLLYGKPGTGKTLFAQILADKTNMDFLPVTAGSLLQSGVEGIKYVNELVDIANRSNYGAIIFVDEADALFVNRDSLDPSSDHYKVLNHILALTGNGSDKFMLIAATNHAYVMDEAMGRRFQDRVLMPLPNATTRKELFELYNKNVLLNTKNNNTEFVKAAQTLLTPQQINIMVEQTDGLSHAEIKDAVHAMHKKALATKTGIITITHINNAIKQAVEKHAALEADKLEREQHHKVIA